MTAGINARVINEYTKTSTFTGIEIEDDEVIFWANGEIIYGWVENDEVIFSEHSRYAVPGEPTFNPNVVWNHD